MALRSRSALRAGLCLVCVAAWLPAEAVTPGETIAPAPDRGRQILALQLARRPIRHPATMSPAEAAASWHGYVERIGKPPALGDGGGHGGGSGAH